MSELNASNLRKEQGNEGPDLVGTTELTSPHYMVPPSGNTAERPLNPEPGTLRFNTDSGSLEYFKGDTLGWQTIDRVYNTYGGGGGSNAGTGTRGLFGIGYVSPSGSDKIHYITIPTLGGAEDFGDTTLSTKHFGCASSITRGIHVLGANVNGPAEVNIIDYVTISTKGNASDFGDATTARRQKAGVNNQTRAVFAGGYREGSSPHVQSHIDYITMAATGNAVDFGDLSNASRVPASVSSSTRGVYSLAHPGNGNILDYITTATLGNASDFGDRTVAADYPTATSNSTRGVFAGGDLAGDSANNVIDYITIATVGNAVDFGDLLSRRTRFVGATASPTRAVFAGGQSPSIDDVMQYVQILSTGNAIDFGDLGVSANFGATGGTISNGHGGL